MKQYLREVDSETGTAFPLHFPVRNLFWQNIGKLRYQTEDRPTEVKMRILENLHNAASRDFNEMLGRKP